MIKYCKGHLQPDSFLLKNSNDIVPLTVDCFITLWLAVTDFDNLLVSLPACLSVCLSASLFVCLSACVFICLPACLPAYPCVCHLSIHLPACLPICLSAHLPACLSMCWSVCRPSIHLPSWLPVFPSIHLSVCPSVCLSVHLSLCSQLFNHSLEHNLAINRFPEFAPVSYTHLTLPTSDLV